MYCTGSLVEEDIENCLLFFWSDTAWRDTELMDTTWKDVFLKALVSRAGTGSMGRGHWVE